MTTRRDFLKTSSLIAGAAAAPLSVSANISSAVTEPIKYSYFISMTMDVVVKTNDVITELKQFENKDACKQTCRRQMSEILSVTKPDYFICPTGVHWKQGEYGLPSRKCYSFLVFMRNKDLMIQLGDKIEELPSILNIDKSGFCGEWFNGWYKIVPATAEEIETSINCYMDRLSSHVIGSGAYSKSSTLISGLITSISLC
jgi:hypothetical protein